MTREASGTSWQPDATPMDGIHNMDGDWMTMWHGNVTAVYDKQGGPRGGKQTFAQSMLMFMAQRSMGEGTLGLRAMASLEPVMGKAATRCCSRPVKPRTARRRWSTASIRTTC